MFIKLTRFKNDGQYYLNMNSVWKFERDNSRFTTIVFIDEHIASVTVDETPEEIMKLIECASISKLTSWSGTGTSNLPNTVNGLTIGNSTANIVLSRG